MSFHSNRAMRGFLGVRSKVPTLKSIYRDYAACIPSGSTFTYKDLPQETLYILDGTSMIYNAFFSREAADNFSESEAKVTASPSPDCLPGDGNEDAATTIPCGALAAMAMHFARFVRDVKPRYLVAAMDVSRETFRTELYPSYKQQRPPAPDDLGPQFPLVAPVLEAMGCHIYSAPGYEADEVMAALSKWGRDLGLNVCIVSGDKDMLQLVRCALRP
jgi:5'-3' exonuclease